MINWPKMVRLLALGAFGFFMAMPLEQTAAEQPQGGGGGKHAAHASNGSRSASAKPLPGAPHDWKSALHELEKIREDRQHVQLNEADLRRILADLKANAPVAGANEQALLNELLKILQERRELRRDAAALGNNLTGLRPPFETAAPGVGPPNAAAGVLRDLKDLRHDRRDVHRDRREIKRDVRRKAGQGSHAAGRHAS